MPFPAALAPKNAHLTFELKDAPKARGLRPSQILDFKVQIRSGLPCDEWDGVAGAALPLIGGAPEDRLEGRAQREREFDVPEPLDS